MANQISNVNTISLTDYNISQKSEIYDLITSLLIATSGIITFMFSFTMKNQNVIFSLILMAIGCGMSVYGLFLCLSKSIKNVNAPSGNTIKEHHLYFDRHQKETLKSIINAEGIPDCIKPSHTNNGILRLDIILSDDNNFAGLQLLEYESYMFQPVTEMHYYAGAEAARINNLLSNYNAL